MFSKKITRQALISLLTAALLLTACNVGATPAPTQDINALSTALVGTTVAQLSVQFTQTALSMPTNTPSPVVTQTSAPTLASLPTLDTSGVASPTLDAAALPTFSFINTPITGAASPAPGFTQVAVLPTSAAQATAAQGDACNNAVFESDITILDGETLKAGTDAQKIWAIRNTGTCTWDEGYSLVKIAGSPEIGNGSFKFIKSSDFVASGQGINIGIWLDVPCKPGKYEGHWRMLNDSGYYFGTILSVYLTVADSCP